jgi:hypothetical protein
MRLGHGREMAGDLGPWIARATGWIARGRGLPSLTSGGLVFARMMASRQFSEPVGIDSDGIFSIFTDRISDT